MNIITGSSAKYHYYINEGRKNHYILHLCYREQDYSPRIVEERQYAFNRQKGESWQQLRERIQAIAHEFDFLGSWPDMKVYRTRKNFNLY